MMSKQEMLQFITSATNGDAEDYKSMQELLKIIVQCFDIDEETGDLYVRVKEVEE